MNIYTIEAPPETSKSKGYITVRCPHHFADGFRCGRQLFRLRCDAGASIEVKCPKCKTTLTVNIVGTK